MKELLEKVRAHSGWLRSATLLTHFIQLVEADQDNAEAIARLQEDAKTRGAP
jgi:hypothetical protein